MSDTEAATVPVVTPVKKTPKKKATAAAAKAKKPASHPKYSDMIKTAISTLKERGGSSRQAILKYVCANYKVESQQARTHLKLALRAGVKNGSLKQAKGTGASGSFRLGDKAEKTKVKKPAAKKAPKPKAAKPKVKKVKKPKAATPKKSPKKAAKKPKAAPAAKKPVEKKVAAKVTKPKPAPAKKAAKKAKSPKKAKAAKK